MDKNAPIIIIGTLIIALAAGAFAIFGNTPPANTTGELDGFATCLKDKGVTFFGAFWCPHCQKTKAMFGSSAKLLPYVECSTPDGNGQLQVCVDKKIESYPTWEFPDGTRTTGEKTLQELAEKSGCELPSGATPAAPVEEGSGSSAQ